MSSQPWSPETEYRHCIQREDEERAAAAQASDAASVGAHVLMAEHYADRAWSLSEQFDLPYRPSGLWTAVPKPAPTHV